jgi:transposase, IS5 family
MERGRRNEADHTSATSFTQRTISAVCSSINDFEVTAASVHDNNVDLTKKGEVCVRDRGYTAGGKGLCIDMIKATRGTPLTKEDKALNRFLAKVRAPVEHPYAVIKRIFHAGRVRVTTVVRVKVRMTFVCTCYNLFRALELASMKKR